MNKHFLDILEKSRAIHDKKAADYTTNPTANPHENFTRASEIASWFPKEYGSHSALIGTKLSRLAALLSSGRIPNNESLDDTFLDLLTYVGLMYSFYKDNAQWPLLKEQALNAIGEPEYIRGLGADLTTTPFKDDQGVNQCWHNSLDVNGICYNCGLHIKNLNRYSIHPDGRYSRRV